MNPTGIQSVGTAPALASVRRWLEARLELARGGTSSNLRVMEGLRGYAVFLVFLVHFATLVLPHVHGGSLWRVALVRLEVIGHSGVDLFFVLSGYLIYGSLIRRPQPFGAYLLRRVQRIYPAFLAVLALYLVLSFVFPNESKLPASAGAAAVYLLQNLLLLPGLFPIEPIITVAWSLSYEFFFYLVVPLMVGALALRQRSGAWRSCLLSAVAVAGVTAAAVSGGPIRLLMFVAGMLVWERQQHPPAHVDASRAGWVWPALLISMLVCLLPTSQSTGGPASYVARTALLAAAFGVLCLVCSDRRRKARRKRSWPGLCAGWAT